MPLWLRRTLGTIGAVLCLGFGLFLHVLWYSSDTRAAMEGRADARRDAAQGRYRFLSAGLLLTSDPGYTGHSRDSNGIEYRNTGCVVRSTSQAYQKPYDETMQQAVMAHFGRDVTQDKNRAFTYLPR
jgi:hypothetical protein